MHTLPKLRTAQPLGAASTSITHDSQGYWPAEAGPVQPTNPLRDDVRADVVIVGGGYTGLWTAWWLLKTLPDVKVALVEAATCGYGPSGRNAGFVNSYWFYLAGLRKLYGDAGALQLALAAEQAAGYVGQFCADEDVEAWYTRAGRLAIAAGADQAAKLDAAVAACAELGVADRISPLSAREVARRVSSPVFDRGALVHDGATIQPARLVQGLRARLLSRGAQIYENTPARGVHVDRAGVLVRTDAGTVRARTGVLAMHDQTVAVPTLGRRLTVSSSHMVVTEPVPDVLEQVGWTGQEALTDGRAFLHYFRTTPDGRIAFGWGGGRVALGGRRARHLEVDRRVIAQVRADLLRVFPALDGRSITHAWGGPIDVSPSHFPIVGSIGTSPVHYAAGFTGNGVGPTVLAGQILAAMALDERGPQTRLPIVEPDPMRVPPEPLRKVGGEIVRAAFLRRERLAEQGRDADVLTRATCAVPELIGMHLGR